MRHLTAVSASLAGAFALAACTTVATCAAPWATTSSGRSVLV